MPAGGNRRRPGVSRRTLVGALPAAARPASIVGRNLRIEWLSDPVGLDTRQPRFRWELSAPVGAKDVRPGPYRVIVSSSLAALQARHGDVWDSGIVTDGALTVTPGEPLNLGSHTFYFWAVATGEGTSQWSHPAQWVTGVIDEWRGRWIAAKPGQHLAAQRRAGSKVRARV